MEIRRADALLSRNASWKSIAAPLASSRRIAQDFMEEESHARRDNVHNAAWRSAADALRWPKSIMMVDAAAKKLFGTDIPRSRR
jgi:hypothetical protein